MGHRIAKHIYNNDNVLEKSTYYILDAQGNTMATYDRVNDPIEMEISFIQSEKHIYGSSRLGVYNDSVPMLGSQNDHAIVDRSLQLDTLLMNVSAAYDSLCLPDAVGKWWFDHSGTTGTVSGQVATFSDNNSSDDWMSVQVSANATPGQTYTLSFDLTGQTNLSYNSVEIRNCSGGGIFDYPLYGDGNYQFTFTIPTDWSGRVRIKWWSYENNSAIPMGYSLSSIHLEGAGVQFSNDAEFVEDSLWTDAVGKRNYELTNHLGNVLSVISDKVIPTDGVTTVYENHFDNIPDNFIYENDFSSSLDGFYSVNGTSIASLSSGRLKADLDVSGFVRIDLPTTAGHKYMINYNVELDTIGVTYGGAVETVSGAYVYGQYQEFTGTYNYLVEATTSSTTFYFYAQDHGTPHTLYLDDFTVNDVTGNTNYDPFFGSYSVSLSIEGNRLKAEHIAVWTQPSMIFSSIAGHTYRATATADIDVASGSYFYFDAFDGGTGAGITGVIINSDGTYSFDFTAIGNTCKMDFQNSVVGEWTLYIDDFKIEDITTSVAYLADIRQSTDYSPFGVQLSGRNLTNSLVTKDFRYGFNGMEMDNEIHPGSGVTPSEGDSYDFGARMLDPRLGRWLTMDALSSKYAPFSPYSFSGNSPINIVDVGGDSLYVLFYTKGNEHGDDMFKGAALTRQHDIENGSTFDPSRDKVVVIGVYDISTIEGTMKSTVDQYSEKYGKTVEVGVWSHSGKDGPVGAVDCSNNQLSSSDPKQMSLAGWGKINYNWGENSRLSFYGCNTGVIPAGGGKSFATEISSMQNCKDVNVFGQTNYAFPSYYTNYRENGGREGGKGDGDFSIYVTKYKEIKPAQTLDRAPALPSYYVPDGQTFNPTYLVGSYRQKHDYNGDEQNVALKMKYSRNGYERTSKFQPGNTK